MNYLLLAGSTHSKKVGNVVDRGQVSRQVVIVLRDLGRCALNRFSLGDDPAKLVVRITRRENGRGVGMSRIAIDLTKTAVGVGIGDCAQCCIR